MELHLYEFKWRLISLSKQLSAMHRLAFKSEMNSCKSCYLTGSVY